MNSKWFDEKENLERFILVENKSYEEIGKLYGCSGANIKKVALRIGIELPKRRNVNESETFGKGLVKVPLGICLNCGNQFKKYSGYSGKYCCSKCQKEYIHKQKYKKIVAGTTDIMRTNYQLKYFRQDIISEQDYKCAICGCPPEHNGKPLVFIIDHIDGHAANNKRDNLRCICPNCDSQLDTYKSKNKNSDREYYRINRRK